MLTKIRQYFIRLLFFLSVSSLGLMLTGSSQREYYYLDKVANATINEITYNSASLAEKYLPNIFISSDIIQSDINKVYYEIIDLQYQIVINYYYDWKQENHPNFALSIVSKIWKFIYYKFELSYLEFVQLNIDKVSGKIILLKTKNKIKNINSFSSCLTVNSWNHDFSLNQNVCNGSNININLIYFEDADYAHLKMARRSQGDFGTSDSIMNYPIIIFLALLASYYFRHLQKYYNNEYTRD